MNCPERETLAAWASGELTPEAQEHLDACATCAKKVEELQRLIAELKQLELAQPAPAFTATLLSNIHSQPKRRVRMPALVLAGLALACVAVFGVIQLPRGFEARGGGTAQRDRVGFDVYVHAAGRAPARLTPGQVVDIAAGYSFVVQNRSRQQQYLMLFALDARSDVHWFYPAFVDAASDPHSIALAATPEVHTLPEGVTPDRPAPGPVHFVALFSGTELSVSGVEKRVRSGGMEALARAYPRLQVLRAELRAGGAP